MKNTIVQSYKSGQPFEFELLDLDVNRQIWVSVHARNVLDPFKHLLGILLPSSLTIMNKNNKLSMIAVGILSHRMYLISP